MGILSVNLSPHVHLYSPYSLTCTATLQILDDWYNHLIVDIQGAVGCSCAIYYPFSIFCHAGLGFLLVMFFPMVGWYLRDLAFYSLPH